MKKTVLFAAALFTVTAASAQTGEITSNRGENWLSQDGDWGLTFEATPLLNYAGNLFNGSGANGGVALNALNPSANAAFGSGVVIGGKKLIDANTAYRAKLRIGFGSNKSTELVSDMAATTPTFVEDVTKVGFTAIDLGFGLEKRVGSSRIVGVYGAELGFGIGGSKTTYEYGNTLDNTGSRITEEKNGSIMSIGLMAFAGVEWFVAPKVSLSGEYTWGLAMRSNGTPSTSFERVSGDTAPTSIEGTPNDGIADKTSSFSLDTGVSGARIGVNFYFQ